MKDVTFGIIQGSFPTDGLVMKLACQYEKLRKWDPRGEVKHIHTSHSYILDFLHLYVRDCTWSIFDKVYWSESHWYNVWLFCRKLEEPLNSNGSEHGTSTYPASPRMSSSFQKLVFGKARAHVFKSPLKMGVLNSESYFHRNQTFGFLVYIRIYFTNTLPVTSISRNRVS